jgi:hypothetical protein
MKDDPVNDLEQDILASKWMAQKIIDSDTYAQNLYAAICNNLFQKNDVWPRIADLYWSCTWRSAGGIIADIRNQGDYMDWYCSGRIAPSNQNSNNDSYVGESFVTDEIRQDLFAIGWTVQPYPDDGFI